MKFCAEFPINPRFVERSGRELRARYCLGQPTRSKYFDDIVENFPSSNIATDIIINNDNDGIATAGETLGLSIPLINHGSQTATNFTATLSAASNQVIIDNATVTYGSILPGSTAYSDNFIISICYT